MKRSGNVAELQIPTRDDVVRARETIADRLSPTPLLSSRTLRARLESAPSTDGASAGASLADVAPIAASG